MEHIYIPGFAPREALDIDPEQCVQLKEDALVIFHAATTRKAFGATAVESIVTRGETAVQFQSENLKLSVGLDDRTMAVHLVHEVSKDVVRNGVYHEQKVEIQDCLLLGGIATGTGYCQDYTPNPDSNTSGPYKRLEPFTFQQWQDQITRLAEIQKAAPTPETKSRLRLGRLFGIER
jgi:hypothetical protein